MKIKNSADEKTIPADENKNLPMKIKNPAVETKTLPMKKNALPMKIKLSVWLERGAAPGDHPRGWSEEGAAPGGLYFHRQVFLFHPHTLLFHPQGRRLLSGLQFTIYKLHPQGAALAFEVSMNKNADENKKLGR